jgi:hypothetical protein
MKEKDKWKTMVSFMTTPIESMSLSVTCISIKFKMREHRPHLLALYCKRECELRCILLLLFLIIIHLFTRAIIVWVISHPCPPPPSHPGRTCSALITNFVEEKT